MPKRPRHNHWDDGAYYHVRPHEFHLTNATFRLCCSISCTQIGKHYCSCNIHEAKSVQAGSQRIAIRLVVAWTRNSRPSLEEAVEILQVDEASLVNIHITESEHTAVQKWWAILFINLADLYLHIYHRVRIF